MAKLQYKLADLVLDIEGKKHSITVEFKMNVLTIALVLTGSAMALPILYTDYGSYQFPGYGDYPSYAPPDTKPPPTKDDAAVVKKIKSGVEE
ncbi:hypothetical protein AC579_4016 [Pseudocercospora musae]|uniref:Uncharacterized protein n=1 Tax=Pseudocercospora musae TaxID=113226 RepID=A0A139IHP3_9PEZI|nr:hypothetical protein AC579_4016 [Pseudocercospora musae]